MGDLKYNGDWKDVQQRLMDKYPVLTEKDFKYENNDDKLLNHLENRLGIESDELRELIRKI